MKGSKTVNIQTIYGTWKDLVILAKITFNPIKLIIKASPASEDTPRYCHKITMATATEAQHDLTKQNYEHFLWGFFVHKKTNVDLIDRVELESCRW